MTVYDKNGNPISPSGDYKSFFRDFLNIKSEKNEDQMAPSGAYQSLFRDFLNIKPNRWTCLRCKSSKKHEYPMDTKFCICGAPQEWSVKK